MPGADVDIEVTRPDNRGLRSPRHLGSIWAQSRQFLFPFMAAPLRPGETLVGVSLQGETWFNSVIDLVTAPLTYAEIGLWVIPISSLHPVFQEMYTQSGEDIFEETGTHLSGSGLTIGELTVAEQGHLTPGLQQHPRRWAGEIGGVLSGEGLSASSYLPYVSFGTYDVAMTYYESETNLDWQNDDLFDNAPLVGKFVRGATDSGFTDADAGVDPDIGTQSFATLLERLFLLSRAEATYAEILAAHGVNPRRVASLPRPVLLKQALLQAQSQPQVAGGVASSPTTILNDENSSLGGGFAGHDFSPVVSGSVGGYLNANRPVGSLRNVWNEFRTGSMFIEEPSILLGTHVWWDTTAQVADYGHMFDMTRMVGPGHWGQVQNGGVEETDFLTVQDLYQRSGDNLQAGSQGESGTNVFNLLNLFLHGDKASIDASNQLADDVNAFIYRTTGGNTYDGENADCTLKSSVQLHVLSDLVGS